MLYHLINTDRSYGGNVGTEPTHSNWTLTPYNGGFIKEFHDVATDTWIESATTEEISAVKRPICEKKLIDCVLHLRDRALISSIMKEENVTYLKGQSETYKEKYKVAKQYCIDQTINDNDWYNAIVNEMNNTNIELGLIGTENELNIPLFMNYIKQAFEIGLERSKKFEPSIEVFRCKAKDLYVVGHFERFEQMIEYAYALPLQMELSQIDGFVNHINQI